MFLNTVNHEHGRDALATAPGFNGWLGDVGFAHVTPVGAAAATEARALREAIRAGLEGGPTDRLTIERAAAAAHLTIKITADGTTLVALAAGVDGVFGALVAQLHAAASSGELRRLKACRSCRWAFYDTSRNVSGAWCSMTICGNRHKLRTYRARRGATP